MGVFYNPQGPMPIAQMGFKSQIGGATGGGRAAKPEKKRDIAAEKWDEERRKERLAKEVIARGGGDIEKTALGLEQVDPKLAQDWEKGAYENSVLESNFKATQAKNQTELTRQAADAASAGNMVLANKIATSIDPNIVSIANTDKKDIKEVSYRNEKGEITKERLSVDGLIKAGTDSATQFNAQAAMDRALLQYSEKNPEATLAKLKAKVYSKMNTAQEYAATYGSMDKAITEAKKKGVDIEFTPAEIDLYVMSTMGNIMGAAIQAKNANPEYIKIWDAKNLGMSPAEFIAKNDIEQLDLMKKSIIKNLGVKLKGEDSLQTPPEVSKPNVDLKISTTTKSHPTASPPKTITIVKDGKKQKIKDSEASRKWAVTNKYTIEE